MAGGFGNVKPEPDDEKVWSICRMPFWNSTTISSSTSSDVNNNSMHHQSQSGVDTSSTHHSSGSLSSLAMSLFPTKRRLSLDPTNKLFFPCMSFLSLTWFLLLFFEFVVVVLIILCFFTLEIYCSSMSSSVLA